MTERVLPLADGASACPFVAFEDDRDERATVPDHRHRCYAEARPAPRALAHQEAYCLSSAFPVCPIFQDWARREAARARRDSAGSVVGAAGAGAGPSRGPSERPAANADQGPAGDGANLADSDAADPIGPADVAPRAGTVSPARATGPGGTAGAAPPGWNDADDDDGGAHDVAGEGDADDDTPRNPPRDWSAPPPWLASRDRPPQPDVEPPPFLGRRTGAGQGLAGSSADRLTGGRAQENAEEDAGAPWTASGSSAAAARAAVGGAPRAHGDDARRGGGPSDPWDEGELEELEEAPRRPARRPRAYAQHLGGPNGPNWERPRRSEAYPTIKTRVGLPNVPRLALLAGLVAVLAVGLYFLPALLGMGSGTGTPGAGATPSPSTAGEQTAAPSPTVAPAPTPSVYTIKRGDSLSKIAKANGITIEELLAANPDIKDPNKISEGQEIILPVASEPPPDEIDGSAEPSG